MRRLLALALLALPLVACGPNSTRPDATRTVVSAAVDTAVAIGRNFPTPTPFPTPVPPRPTATPVPSDVVSNDAPIATHNACPADPQVCALAARVDDALTRGDIEPLYELFEPLDADCSAHPIQYCTGVPPGQHLIYIPGAASPGEDTFFLYGDLNGMLTEELSEGLRLRTIGCPTSLPDLATCHDLFSLDFTYAVASPNGGSLQVFVELPVTWSQDGQPQVSFRLGGSVTLTEGGDVLVGGGVLRGGAGLYPLRSQIGVFLPWQP